MPMVTPVNATVDTEVPVLAVTEVPALIATESKPQVVAHTAMAMMMLTPTLMAVPAELAAKVDMATVPEMPVVLATETVLPMVNRSGEQSHEKTNSDLSIILTALPSCVALEYHV